MDEGTLIAIDNDRPYAIELSYATDGEFIYCGSMPAGTGITHVLRIMPTWFSKSAIAKGTLLDSGQ